MASQSLRNKLQAIFVALGLAAIVLTGWEASYGAATALEKAAYDRLVVVRETKRRQIEDYFRDVQNHVLALAADESTIQALEEFEQAWDALPAPAGDQGLRAFYLSQVAPRVEHRMPPAQLMEEWYPRDVHHLSLQLLLIAANPYPAGMKELLLRPPGAGRYAAAHVRYHPTLQRYQSAFGFYDVLLLSASSGRVLYSVFKEIDLGHAAGAPPLSGTGLGRAFQRAMNLTEPEASVTEDYTPYVPSVLTPAAFVAAPVWRAGAKIGVLAIQIPIAQINRVLTGNRNWEAEGLGRTGQAYLVGPDATLRSDLREEIEQPEGFYRHLAQAGARQDLIDRIRRDKTVILTLPAPEDVMPVRRAGARGAGTGVNYRRQPVLRAYSPVNAGELDWFLVAEIDEAEVRGPVRTLLLRIAGVGLLIAVAFFLAAWWLARSVTGPVIALSENAARLGQRDFGGRVPVTTRDEIGDLARAFNSMAENLERTTVSRDHLDRANQELRGKQEQLEQLTARLIEAQEMERRRLGRELHDDVTQRVAALAIEVGRLQNQASLTTEGLKAGFEHIKDQLIHISGDIHGLSRRLHPATLEDLGLEAAIESECRSFFERGGPPVDLVLEGELVGLSPDQRLGLFRIVQESLRNIERHAGADEVRLRLAVSAGRLTLEISDNGKGFSRDESGWRTGLGLASMRERAQSMGGSFEVDSTPGRGATVRVIVPIGENVKA